jgi:hypothetical protein
MHQHVAQSKPHFLWPNHLWDFAILHLGGALWTVASSWLPVTVNPVAEASVLCQQTIECSVSPGSQSSGTSGLVVGYSTLEPLCAQVKAHMASCQIPKHQVEQDGALEALS